MLIDTHAHLNFPDFERDLDEVVNNAVKNGVTKIICVSSNVADSQKAIEIAQEYPGIVYAAIGIHPQQTDPENQNSIQVQVKELEELAKQKEVVAIGECGLDYSPASPETASRGGSAPPNEKDRTKEEQIFLFQKQLELAQKLNLPIIIHSRKAYDDVFSILGRQLAISNLSGVFHCYAAGKTEIKKVEEVGFYFGIDGNLTYDVGLQNVIKQIPLEKIILETDSPFLAPLPLRGLRNEPANVKIIAEFLTTLLGVSFTQICQKTSQNAQEVFTQTR